MKTKLLNIWHNLGINAKAMIIVLAIVLFILLLLAFLVLLFIVLGDNIKYLLLISTTYSLISIYKFTKQWLQQNKEN